MIAQYQGKKLIKKATKKEEEKIEKSIQAYYNEYKMSQWNRWAKEFGLIPNIKVENVRNGIIITRRIKGLTPKRLSWDRSAIKEQKKLEQEQQDIKNLSFTIKQYWNFICSNKIYWGELEKFVRPLLEKYNVILEN